MGDQMSGDHMCLEPNVSQPHFCVVHLMISFEVYPPLHNELKNICKFAFYVGFEGKLIQIQIKSNCVEFFFVLYYDTFLNFFQ